MYGVIMILYSHTNNMDQIRFFANEECPGEHR